MGIIKDNTNKQKDFTEQPRIIRAVQLEPAQRDEQIPFVPAFDLLEAAEQRLSDSEAAAVGFALLSMLPTEENSNEKSGWQQFARRQAISQGL